MSLGLVAYGSSGESESEEENEVSSTSSLTGSVQSGKPTQSVSSSLNSNAPREGRLDKPTISEVQKDSYRGNEAETKVTAKSSDDPVLSGQIEDDEYDILPTPSSATGVTGGFMKLPPPKQNKEEATQLLNTSTGEAAVTNNPLAALPPPKPASAMNPIADLEEDELEEEVKPKVYEDDAAEKPPGKSKPEKRTVQITIPALPQDEGDEPAEKKPKLASSTGGKSGLFSLLPAPKHEATKVVNRALIPDSVSKRPAAKLPHRPAASGGKSTEKKAPNSTTTPTPSHSVVDTADSDEDDEDTPNFFSLGDSNRTFTPAASGVRMNPAPTAELPPPAFSRSDSSDSHTAVSSSVSQDNTEVEGSASEEGSMQTVIDMDAPLMFGRSNVQHPLPYKTVPVAAEVEPGVEASEGEEQQGAERDYAYPQYNEELAGVSSYASADDVETFAQDDQFLRLQGKKQRGKEAIEIIDVNQDDQMSHVDLMKTMTEETEQVSYSRKKKDLPSAQQRRKHQITHLAYLAKERELTLKNQWAENRQTRKQTQSKYGF